MSNPRCDLCGQFLIAKSDAPFGYGALTFVHAKPCVPKRGRKTLARKIAKVTSWEVCIECGISYRVQHRKRKMCSDFCANERKNRACREKRAA